MFQYFETLFTSILPIYCTKYWSVKKPDSETDENVKSRYLKGSFITVHMQVKR